MADRKHPSPLFIAFIAAMALLMVIGAFLLVYGSLTHVPLRPTLKGPGMFAGGGPHA